MKEELAPVILFVYNRLEHTKRTINALKENYYAEDSELFIYSDGAKDDSHKEKVEAVRRYVHQVDGFRRVHIIERTENYGLARSIVEGVSEVIEKYGKIIVLEDDLITDKCFLRYMNEGLSKYKNTKQIDSITGYSYLPNQQKDQNVFFLGITSSWSWGTWQDRWCEYNFSYDEWIKMKKNRGLRKAFDYGYAYPFYTLLKNQIEDEKTNSWAIIWYWTVFCAGGLTIYPPMTLINNVGFDGSGEHCTVQRRNSIEKDMGETITWEFGNECIEKQEMKRKVVREIRGQLSVWEKILLIKEVIGL